MIPVGLFGAVVAVSPVLADVARGRTRRQIKDLTSIFVAVTILFSGQTVMDWTREQAANVQVEVEDHVEPLFEMFFPTTSTTSPPG